MKNKGLWKETFVKLQNNEYIINNKLIDYNSLLVAKQTFNIYKELIQTFAEGVLVDLGCGNVPYYGIYKNQVEEVICIDWGTSYHECKHLDYIADINKGIPLESNFAQTIILTDVLEHINNPERLMTEISRVMKIGGRLILGVPFLYWLHEEPYDFNRYTKFKLLELCRSNGLEVIYFAEVGGPLTVISDIIGKSIPSPFFSKLFQECMIIFLNTSFGKKIDNRNKIKFPRSYCLVAEKIKFEG